MAGVPIPPAVLFALMAAVFTGLGLVFVAVRREWTRRHIGWFTAFAAGALMSVAVLHLLPEALATTPAAPLLMLAGFVVAFSLDSAILAMNRRSGRQDLWRLALVPLCAIAFHSFVDGIAYAVTFSVDFETGLATVMGLIFHEVPEGIILFTLLQRVGVTDRTAFVLSVLGAGLTTPLGAVTASVFVDDLGDDALGALFAITAGVLLFMGTSHLLPHVRGEPLRRKGPALVVGGLIGVASMLFHGHQHDHEHGGPHDHPETEEGPGHGDTHSSP